MENKKNIRTIFIEACNKIVSLLDDRDFKILQKGQTLKKVSANKDLYYEIYFQSSFRNSDWDIQILPHVNIYSKKLKKWMIEQTKNPYASGIIYSKTLGYISPCGYRVWNVAGMSGENEINNISELLNKYALPIFHLFDDIQTAIIFLKEHGTVFNKYTKPSLMPLSFMLYYASPEDAEIFFNDYVNNLSYRGRIFSLYKELKTAKNIDLNHSEFVDANRVKLAFINGLKLHNMK